MRTLGKTLAVTGAMCLLFAGAASSAASTRGPISRRGVFRIRSGKDEAATRRSGERRMAA